MADAEVKEILREQYVRMLVEHLDEVVSIEQDLVKMKEQQSLEQGLSKNYKSLCMLDKYTMEYVDGAIEKSKSVAVNLANAIKRLEIKEAKV